MDICEVCLENNGDLSSRININSEKWKEINMQKLIEKHFWWWSMRQPISKEHMQWICQQCWQELTAFHKFAQRIKKSHKLYKYSMQKQNLQVYNEADPLQMAVAELGSTSSGQQSAGMDKEQTMQTEEVHIKKEPYLEMDDNSAMEPSQMVVSELGGADDTVKETTAMINDEMFPYLNSLQRKNIQHNEVYMDKASTYTVTYNNESILPNLEYSINQHNDNALLNNSDMMSGNNSVAEIKYLIAKQNINIANMLAEQTQNIKSMVTSFREPPKYITLFPIKSADELLHWENTINEDNKQDMVKSVTAVMGEKGIVKGLPLIISQNLLIDFNLEGLHNKKRLKNYTQIMDVLFYSFTTNSINEKEPQTFESELRKAFKNAKNRHFKDTCIKNKKLKLEETTAAISLN